MPLTQSVVGAINPVLAPFSSSSPYACEGKEQRGNIFDCLQLCNIPDVDLHSLSRSLDASFTYRSVVLTTSNRYILQDIGYSCSVY